MHRALSLLLLSLLASCASTGSAAPKGPAQVTYRQYHTGTTLTIVNESHTDRLEKYSTLGADASVKVTSDEVMDELLSLADQLGLATTPGPAPTRGEQPVLASIELSDPNGVRHALRVAGAPSTGFVEYQQNFILLFNQIYAPQAVEADPSIFDGGR